MSALSVLNTYVPSAKLLLQDTPNEPASCALALYAENLAMWAPVAQLLPQLTHPLTLPEWATLEGFESVPQGYKGGNVTVLEAPTSFSLFSLVDCMLFSHFSFSDFIAVAFLDLAGDLDIQI